MLNFQKLFHFAFVIRQMQKHFDVCVSFGFGAFPNDCHGFDVCVSFGFGGFPERWQWMRTHSDVCMSFGFGAFPNDCHGFDVCVSLGFGAFPNDCMDAEAI
jgi:hypothetical protein